jgi:hypothetical protein
MERGLAHKCIPGVCIWGSRAAEATAAAELALDSKRFKNGMDNPDDDWEEPLSAETGTPTQHLRAEQGNRGRWYRPPLYL